MKKIIYALAVLVTTSIYGQSEFQITTGPAIEENKKRIYAYFGENDGNYYFGGNRNNKKDYTLFKLNNQFELVKAVELDLDSKLKTYFSDNPSYGFNLVSTDNENLYFMRAEGGKLSEMNVTYFMDGYSLDDLSSVGNPKPVTEESNIPKSGVRGLSAYKGFINTASSKDEKRHALSLGKAEFSYNNSSYQLVALKDGANIAFQTEFPTEDYSGRILRENMAVSNNGEVYVLAADILEGKKLEKYVLFQYSESGELKNQIEFVPSGFIFTQPFLEIHPDGSVILAGFTSTKSSKTIDGLAFFRFSSEELELIAQNQHKLPEEFEELSKGIKKGVIKHYGRIHSAVTTNGDFAIATDYIDYSGNQTGTVFSDLFAWRLNGSGEVVAKGLIKKEQAGSGASYPMLSYRMFAVGNSVMVFYNGNEKNLERTIDKSAKRTSMGKVNPVFVAELEATGFNRQILFDSSKDRFVLPVYGMYQISENSILFTEYSSSEFRIRRVDF